MRKSIFIIASVFSLISCQEKAPVDYAIVTGKIENLETKVVKLTNDNLSFSKEITVEPNGTFLDTIKSSPGFYIFSAGKNKTQLHLDHGDNIILSANANTYYESLEVSGKGSKITNYIRFKNKKATALKGKSSVFYALDEANFKTKAKRVRDTLSYIIDTVKGINPEFKAIEKRNLHYSYLLNLSRYASGYHAARIKNKKYIASNEFLSELKELDVNNEEEYKLSNVYRVLLQNYYINDIRELAKKDSLEYIDAKVKFQSKLANQFIRNDLMFGGAEYAMTKTEDYEGYYQTFISASTDEENNAKITTLYNNLQRLEKGNPSPKFINFKNHAGGTLSLDDLKGKYTYIDVWATWCAPCLAQVPYLKEVEKTYHGKNINFLSISIDAPDDYEKWKQMVTDKALGGIQLITENGPKSEFTDAYFVFSIPRFILLDPDGLIVSKQAPRPSSPELIELFNSLNI